RETPHADPADRDRGVVRRPVSHWAYRPAALGGQSSVLSALPSLPAVLAVLRGDRDRRHRRGGRHRAIPRAGGAALLLRRTRPLLLRIAGLLSAALLRCAVLLR